MHQIADEYLLNLNKAGETYKYDTFGNLTECQTESGYILRYGYDMLNRLTTITDSDGGVERMQYNKNGNLIIRISPQENAALGANAHGYRYTYDILGRNTENKRRASRLGASPITFSERQSMKELALKV